jgi:hypothetical protein
VDNAVAAQPGWAATNPQRRARVMMRFVELVNQHMDELARLLSSEHGKTIPDSKGDIQRGLEVAEFAIGIPHLLKGEYTESAGTGIDVYSMRQPLGVVAGITPFNFPAMIPLWKAAPAIACGNAFILKPSERDPSVPLRLAELFIEAGLPPGILNVVNGDKIAVDALLEEPRIKAVGFVGRLRLGRRALHGDFRRRSRGRGDRPRAHRPFGPARGSLARRHLQRRDRRLRSAGHARSKTARHRLYRHRREGGCQTSGGWQRLQAARLRGRVFSGRQPVRPRDA